MNDSFMCAECGGNVILMAKPGRTRVLFKGVTVSIPDDFKLFTCSSCGEEYMTPEISEKLDAILIDNLKNEIDKYHKTNHE